MINMQKQVILSFKFCNTMKQSLRRLIFLNGWICLFSASLFGQISLSPGDTLLCEGESVVFQGQYTQPSISQGYFVDLSPDTSYFVSGNSPITVNFFSPGQAEIYFIAVTATGVETNSSNRQRFDISHQRPSAIGTK